MKTQAEKTKQPVKSAAKKAAPQKVVGGKASVKTAAKKMAPEKLNKPATTAAKAIKATVKKSVAIQKVAEVKSKPPVVQPAAAVPASKPGRRGSSRGYTPVPSAALLVPTHSPDAAKASYAAPVVRLVAVLPAVAIKKNPKLANNWKTKSAHDLTDPEVLSMPDEEYMNETQLAFFRHKLLLLKQEILANAGETTEHLREDAAVVPDPADRATIEEEHALELRTRDRERKLLKKIEQSLVRIDATDYGYCDETGEAIGVGRLLARPTANLSLEAQQRRELKQKMFGD